MQRPQSMTALCRETDEFWARKAMFLALKFVVKTEHVGVCFH